MNKKLLFALFIIGLLSLNFINAEISKGNSSGAIKTIYGIREPIEGWINLSINKVANSSVLNTFFNLNPGKDINIQELLNSNGLYNGAGYSCYPWDCSENITTTGDSTSKTVTLNKGESKVLGIKILSSELVGSVRSIEFDISSNGGNSCFVSPLKIDVLNEGTYEYFAQNLSNELCSIPKPHGCFDSTAATNSTELEQDIAYCEKVEIPPYKSYLIGANISMDSIDLSKNVKITMDAGCGEKECIGNISSNSIKCAMTIDCELNSIRNATICIKPQQPTLYKIKYEKTGKVCGYLIDDEGEYTKDFEIFAYPIKYRAVGSFKFNKSIANIDDLSSAITDNLGNRYLNNGTGINCSKGCVIPIKFLSGLDNQQIIVNNVKVNFTDGGIKRTSNSIGEVISSPPIITVMNPSKLNLDEINILTPNSVGTYQFSIKQGSNELFKSNITVSDVIQIADIIPKEGVALVNNTFIAVFDRPMNQTAQYFWEFGSEDPIITSGPIVKYKFDNTEDLSLTLTLVTNQGNSTKTISIQVDTPDTNFNKTIKLYREKLANFSFQLSNSNINDFAKREIESIVKPLDLKTELDDKERLYFGYLDSQENEKLRVMGELLAMRVPGKLDVSQSIKNSKYLQSSEKISFEKLEEFGAGTVDGDDADFKKKISSWINENMEINFESNTYRIIYSTGEADILFSDMVFNLNPKADIPQVYFVIDSPSLADKIKISNGELKTKESEDNNAFLVSLSDLSNNGSIRVEFLYPLEASIITLPVYISPDLVSVGGNIRINTGDCNNDGKCSGKETYKNCPGDCKPWSIAIILIVVLLFVAFVIYILMQEWYKRHYESYLFTNKIQLYNLINFMYNSSNQGTNKSEIFSKLKEREWTGEQLSYAWKKFKGQRVGMWEIPIFKWVENKQVKKELIKRNPGLAKNDTL